jgi:hypothetical protein
MLSMVCLVMVSVSCNQSKQEAKKQPKVTEFGDCQLLELDGKYGLAYKNRAFTEVKYDSIWRVDSLLTLAKEGESVTVITDRRMLFDSEITGVESLGDGLYILTAKTRKHIVKCGERSYFGSYQDLQKVGDYVFVQDEDMWGVFKLSDGARKLMAQSEYKKVYILEGKKRSALVVMTKTDQWEMYTLTGVKKSAKYQESSAEIGKLLKPYSGKMAQPYGTVKVKFL